MIEAALYFPLVLMFIFVIILLSMFKLQNCLKQYANDKAADITAKNLNFSGYDGFYSDSSVLSGENVTIPSAAEITDYYKYRQTKDVLYRRVNNYYTSANKAYQNILSLAGKYRIFYTVGSYVSVDYNSELDRTVSYTYDTEYYIPFFSSYGSNLGLSNTSKTYATNPADLVRVTDAANDNAGMEERGISFVTLKEKYQRLRYLR